MKLSVCVPVYKVEQYIERCARSLFEQTLDDMEFVFVDDCSPDCSLAVVERVLADYPMRRRQVRLIRHQTNSGSAQARKTAMSLTSGDWIGFCDADDWVDSDFFRSMVEAGERADAGMVFAPMCRNENGRMEGEEDVVFNGSSCDYLNTKRKLVAFHSTCNKIYRRGIATDPAIVVPEPVGIGEDTCFMIQAVACCRRVVSVTGVFYHYRENLSSKTRTFDPRKAINDLGRVYRVLEDRGLCDKAFRFMGKTARDIAFYGIKFGVMRESEYKWWMNESSKLLKGDLYHSLPLKRVLFLWIGYRWFTLAGWLLRIVPHSRQGGI